MSVIERSERSERREDLVARLLIALVRAYQITISPWLGKVCRFEPSCSRYAVACLERHGAIRGGLLSVKRLCKCHPFHPGGYDPPPSRDDARPATTREGQEEAA